MLERTVWATTGATRLPHTKWAWRRRAKCVICEVGLICGRAFVPAALPMWAGSGAGSGSGYRL